MCEYNDWHFYEKFEKGDSERMSNLILKRIDKKGFTSLSFISMIRYNALKI